MTKSPTPSLRILADEIHKRLTAIQLKPQILGLPDLLIKLENLKIQKKFHDYSVLHLSSLLKKLLEESNYGICLYTYQGTYFCADGSEMIPSDTLWLHADTLKTKVKAKPKDTTMLKVTAERILRSSDLEVWQRNNHRILSPLKNGRYLASEVNFRVQEKRDYLTLEDVEELFDCSNKQLKLAIVESTTRGFFSLEEAKKIVGWRGRVYYIPDVLTFAGTARKLTPPLFLQCQIHLSSRLNNCNSNQPWSNPVAIKTKCDVDDLTL